MSSHYVVWLSAPRQLRGLSWVDPTYIYEIDGYESLAARLAAAQKTPKDPEDLIVVIAAEHIMDPDVHTTLIVGEDSPNIGRIFIVRPKRKRD